MSSEFSRPLYASRRFENPFSTFSGLPGKLRLLKWLLSEANYASSPAKPEELDKTLPVVRPEFSYASTGPYSVSWLGHATSLIQMNGQNIITDPIFSSKPSPCQWLGSSTRYRPPPCDISDLPMPLVVLISHNHYDHLDYGSVKSIHEHFGSHVTWFVPLGLKSWFQQMSIKNVIELNWWDEVNHDGGLLVACTPAQHWCRRGIFDHNKVLWCSWTISDGYKTFHFAGDTGYCPAFKEIGQKYGPIECATIPIGCYSPRDFMKAQHVDPQEAVLIHKDLNSKFSVGVHWGTFNMGSNEPYLEPRERLREEVEKAGLGADEFVTLKHGQTMTF